jgi:lauroyl/myristoyl acyltransferase
VRAFAHTLLNHPEFWHTVRCPVDEVAPIMASGRGIVLTSIHSPTMWISGAVASAVLGYDIMWAATEALLGDDPSRPADRGAATVAAAGSELIRVRESYRLMGDRLKQRGIVGVLFDVPGRIDVQLLGKRTSVHPWFARLARKHQAAILPCMGCWARDHLALRFGTPVIPEKDDALSTICQRVATSLEPLWAAYPHHWSPYTSQLWPDDIGPYLWAFDGH